MKSIHCYLCINIAFALFNLKFLPCVFRLIHSIVHLDFFFFLVFFFCFQDCLNIL